MVLGFTFRSWIHFEFIFVHSVNKIGHTLPILQMIIQRLKKITKITSSLEFRFKTELSDSMIKYPTVEISDRWMSFPISYLQLKIKLE